MKDIHIMLVDDEPSILDFTERYLEKMGYSNITSCLSGQLALEKYQENTNSFDIIISDLNMPEMNGVELLRHLSEEDYSGGIILLSGEDKRILEVAKDLARASNLNVMGYISKPFKQESLELLLSQYSSQDPRISAPLLDEISAFQAQTKLDTGKVTGVEALARWNHSERGLLPPYTFIPLAERCQLIDELAYNIYRKTLSQISAQLKKDIIIEVSINIFVNYFNKDGFVDFLINTAEEYNVNPDMIIFEITESQIMENSLECLEKLMLSV